MYFVPEGQSDRSQARSAWEVPPGEPSRRVRYARALLNPGGLPHPSAFRTDDRAVVRCDEPFPEDIDFHLFQIRNTLIPIVQSPSRSAHTCKNQNVPYGTGL